MFLRLVYVLGENDYKRFAEILLQRNEFNVEAGDSFKVPISCDNG